MKTYERVSELISDALSAGQWESGLPSERDLAAEFGVSRGSVEKALARLERLGVMRSRLGAGHEVATRPPTQGIFKTVLLSSTCAFDGYLTSFFEDAYHAILGNARKQMSLFAEFCDFKVAQEKHHLLSLLRRPPQGIYAFPFVRHHRLVHLDLWKQMMLKGVRLVFLFRDVREIIAPSISVDQRAVIDAFLGQLGRWGCTRFVDCGNTGPVPGRAEAWRLFYGDGKRHFTLDLPEESDNGAERRALIQAGLARLALPKNEKIGLFCADAADVLLAHQAMTKLGFAHFKAMHDGRMPFHAFDRYGLSREGLPRDLFAQPSLDYRSHEMGALAADLMLRMLEKNHNYAASVVLKPFFGSKRAAEEES
jgi:DNA-binding LacI/PurR family transcriptional regulator